MALNVTIEEGISRAALYSFLATISIPIVIFIIALGSLYLCNRRKQVPTTDADAVIY